ncbi:tetratricopeptide repeat protein [Fundicoccus culcitae]|uniref:Helix-hairpin-helix domain-containing protein n=1 Tax=Fundicoccus culcitae TaxID=2969821 RepID=A0ABY5P8P1_9LACT|nr:hypothetical protein [Fundicoccus culcitae]UUX34960.1 hypothetical protein NRE15_04760 [Fundicoccus culcitae]
MRDEFKFEKEFQEFIKKNGHLYKTDEELVHAFLQEIFGDLTYKENLFTGFDVTEGNPQKSLELVEQALDTDVWSERKALLEKALDEWPDNYDAQILLIDPNCSIVERIEQLEDIYDDATDFFDLQEQEGWLNFEERPYIRLQHYLGSLYMENGMYNSALDVFLSVAGIDESDGAGIRYQIMSTYALMNDYTSATEFFQEIEDATEDEGMIIPLLFTAVLDQDYETAESLMRLLITLNSQVGELFTEDFWPLEKIFKAQDQSFTNLTEFTYLAQILANLTPLVTSSEFLYVYLKNLYESLQQTSQAKEPELLIPDPVVSNKVIEFPKEKVRSMPTTLEQPLFSGLTEKQVAILNDLHLNSFEAFTKVTENDVLSIKGIGPATINKLRVNGVVFLGK